MVYDATADLYVDGRKIEGDTKDTRLGKTLYPRRYFIKEDAKILAITVNRSPGKVRFMVTSNFGVHSSDGQWKCTTRFSHYWFLPPFDDSDWPPQTWFPTRKGLMICLTIASGWFPLRTWALKRFTAGAELVSLNYYCCATGKGNQLRLRSLYFPVTQLLCLTLLEC